MPVSCKKVVLALPPRSRVFACSLGSITGRYSGKEPKKNVDRTRESDGNRAKFLFIGGSFTVDL